MKITDEQRQVLDSLIVERLCENPAENARLVNGFSNSKNKNLERIITSRKAFDHDSQGITAYYVVKTKSGDILLYFSLKCGELFERLDHDKMTLAYKIRDLVSVASSDDATDAEKKKAEDFIKENRKKIFDLLPDIEKYVRKKGYYQADMKNELSKEINRVLKTYPAIELVEFCANDNARDVWKSFGLPRRMGECIFWHHIVKRLLCVRDIVGFQYIYLFAADSSYDGTLANYYKVSLGFSQDTGLGANKPKYDFKCYFLCQQMSGLAEKRTFFYEHFNPDQIGNDTV